MAVLPDVKGCLLMGFDCASLIVRDERLSVCLLAICVFVWRSVSLGLLPPFLLDWVVCCCCCC